jgi:hypothetical protein
VCIYTLKYIVSRFYAHRYLNKIYLVTYRFQFNNDKAQLRFNETVTSWSPLEVRREEEGGGDGIDNEGEKKRVYKIITSDNDGKVNVYYTHNIVLSVGPWGPELYGKKGQGRI